ncbi:MAG: disulfide bond formation protein B [Azovibrio sp.]|nr:disulfide bond formation protein B [Azovibrio sp.]
MDWLNRLGARRGLLLLGGAALALVVAGWALQEWYRLNPCPLCIFQRLLYLLLAVVALLGAALPRAQRGASLGVAALAVAGLATAAYQSLMQAFPDVVSECSYVDPGPIERLVDWLGMQYPPLFMATGFCGSREWEFLGLSMANWSLLCFAAFAVLASCLCRRA